MPEHVRSLEDLLRFVIDNPTVARVLKDDPARVAEIFGIELSQEEQARIRANLDLQGVLDLAQTADSMAAKVAAGIGLPRSEERAT
jgi:hypothetical protein